MKFVLEPCNIENMPDFMFTLIQSVDYQKWAGNNDIEYEFSADFKGFKDYVPIGSIEYVLSFMDYFKIKKPKPLNIPKCFPMALAGRKIEYIHIEHPAAYSILNEHPGWHIKDSDNFKSICDFVDSCSTYKYIKNGNYQLSKKVDIISEWRIFVYKEKIVDIKNYAGDFFIFPDMTTINHFMNFKEFKKPIAYSFDVYIDSGNGTYLLEMHDFFSTGFYGFSDYKIIPFMFYNWFKEYVRKIQK